MKYEIHVVVGHRLLTKYVTLEGIPLIGDEITVWKHKRNTGVNYAVTLNVNSRNWDTRNGMLTLNCASESDLDEAFLKKIGFK